MLDRTHDTQDGVFRDMLKFQVVIAQIGPIIHLML